MTRVVTFDCWQTLIHAEARGGSRRVRVEVLHEVVRQVGSGADAEAVAAAFDHACGQQFAAWCAGEHAGAHDVARWTLDALGVGEAFAEVAAQLVPALEDATLHEEVRALPGSLETLSALRARGVRTALVCDTGLAPGRVVRRLLERCELAPWLDAFVFSDEIGAPKPHPSMFEAALIALGARPEHATHVGDLRQTDIAGARAVGMRTVRIRAVHDDAGAHDDADHVADDHAQLREILGLR